MLKRNLKEILKGKVKENQKVNIKKVKEKNKFLLF